MVVEGSAKCRLLVKTYYKRLIPCAQRCQTLKTKCKNKTTYRGRVMKPVSTYNREGQQFFFFFAHLAAWANQAYLAECWAEGCFHALKCLVLAKGNLLSLHKNFHGSEINKLSLQSKCNHLCFEKNTECAWCHFYRADKENVCVCVCV